MRVFVGLSGGVDSAVSAALLKEQGYGVTGVFIKIWQPEFIECTWREDRLDAMRVAAHLGIPFREQDLSAEYKREVVDAMIAEYARGVTPNPDVACNSEIKFGHFLRCALAEGADFVATGHYARIQNNDLVSRYSHHNDLRGRYELLRGADTNKDQSYFLYTLTQEQLPRALFPIGELTKKEVRVLAKRFKLPNADKPDSQGICFVGDISMEEFLARFIPLSRGAVLDTQGSQIGKHAGAALYTVGQRRGFSHRGGVESREHYVVAIDTKANTITVSENRFDAARKEIWLERVNWIVPPSFPTNAEAQARYRERPVAVRVSEIKGRTLVTFAEPHIAARGQSLVLYSGDACLGGGVIQ